jgi:hypothetical protein
MSLRHYQILTSSTSYQHHQLGPLRRNRQVGLVGRQRAALVGLHTPGTVESVGSQD